MTPAPASPREHGQARRRPLRQFGPATLPLARRLQRRASFLRVREEGERLVGRLMILNLMPAPDSVTQVGMIATRQFEKRATRRNRARRLLREAFRRLQSRLDRPLWIVFVARRYLLDSSVGAVQAEMIRLLTQAGVWSAEGENP